MLVCVKDGLLCETVEWGEVLHSFVGCGWANMIVCCVQLATWHKM